MIIVIKMRQIKRPNKEDNSIVIEKKEKACGSKM
jgi:hypothetical protein